MQPLRTLRGLWWRVLVWSLAAPGWIAAAEPASTSEPLTFEQALQPFLQRYCLACHGPDQQKGERRFDSFSADIRDDNALVDAQEILDQLNLGQMPPKKSAQPTDNERRTAVAWLTERIARYHEEHRTAATRTVLRRLNAREYRNTVRDLLRLEMLMFDPTAAFPRDQVDDHFDNVGATLVTSGHLLGRYLDAAERIVDKTLQPVDRPTVRSWTFRDGFRQQPEIDQVHGRTNAFSHLTLYDVVGADKPEGAYGPLLAFRDGVPCDGIYELRFRAEAVNRVNPYDPRFLKVDPEEPLRLGIVAGNASAGPMHKPQPIEPLLAEMDLADESRWYTVRVWLDRGFSPRFTFQNGLMDVRNLWSRVIRQYPDQFPERKTTGIVEARFNAIKYGRLPQIHIHEVEIKGPLLEAWPTAAQRALLGDDAEQILAQRSMSEDQMRMQLTRFLARAYRRPAQPDEVARLLQLIASRRGAGRTPLEAWGDAVQAVLCSPSFLFLDETTDEAGRLTPYGLASRLSYFLWSSLPDEELLELAANGTLAQPAVLEAQVERMLADERSTALVDGFLASWLTMRDLGSSPPDRDKFPAYYHHALGPAMRRETELFTRHLLTENIDIINFLDSDFTYVNKPLARMYGIQGPTGTGFERVALKDPRRGGLLGQASVLTVTANGIDTSPVVRGVWLLDNILGTPPSPPPPDVEPLDPDVRGTTTIRAQLEKHRNNPACLDCHRQIDPIGFALENFDPIGQWRTMYDRHNPINASGELPDGQSFQNVVEFKRILVGQRELFTRSLTDKLLKYGTGRHLHPADRPHIDRIISDLDRRGNGFRDLIKLVVLSEPFRSE